MEKLTYATLRQFRVDFWGHRTLRPRDRRAKVQHLLGQAHKEYARKLEDSSLPSDQFRKPFCFIANGADVCEKVFVFLIGMCDFQGRKSKTWNDEVDIYLGNS